jgi:hypothetical protein
MSDGGKGSSPRPFSVSNEEYAKRWDAIFGRDLEHEKTVEYNFDKVDLSQVLPQTVKENVEDFLNLSKGDNSE